MFNFRAFYQDKMYDVSSMDFVGTIKYVYLLDIYNGDDGECPILKVQITSLLNIMISSHNVDKNGLTIFDGDIVRTNNNRILHVMFNDESDYFDLGYEHLTCDTVLDLDLVVIGNIHENRNLLF